MKALPKVETVAEARSGLSQILAGFRSRPDSDSVIIGSHRRPEAVLMPYGRYLSVSGVATTVAKSDLLDDVQARAQLVGRLASLSHVTSVAVFGSVSRRAETPESDLDLLVDLDEEASLFDLAQFELDMEALFCRRVDAVSRAALDPTRDSRILREAIAL